MSDGEEEGRRGKSETESSPRFAIEKPPYSASSLTSSSSISLSERIETLGGSNGCERMKRLIRRLAKVMDSSQYEPLEAACKTDGKRSRVPVGHVPVCVGEEMERFAVRAELLGRPAFVELLRRSAMEYGYDQVGVLRIPCSVRLFRRLLLTAGDDFAADEVVRSLLDSGPFVC